MEGKKLYWLSWDGKRKGEYTIRDVVGHKDGYLYGKVYLKERKRPILEANIIYEIDELSRFNLHESRRYFAEELHRDIFEKKIQPYL